MYKNVDVCHYKKGEIVIPKLVKKTKSLSFDDNKVYTKHVSEHLGFYKMYLSAENSKYKRSLASEPSQSSRHQVKTLDYWSKLLIRSLKL